MKLRLLVFILALSAAGVARAGSIGYAYCSTYDAYVLLYKSTDTFEELGKLRCNEKVEVLTRWLEYYQVRTKDGRVGWVRSSDISGDPASPEQPKTPFGLTDPAAPPAEEVALPLGNRNILNMHGMRLSADVIIAKIQSSRCDFDTSAGALEKLKQAGLPDRVILAMIQAPSASAEAAADTAKPAEMVVVKIPNGTALEAALDTSASSETVQQGTILPMTILQDVEVNGVTVFQRGTVARARVIAIIEPGRMGHPGQIEWAMQDVTAVNGDHVPVDFASESAAANPDGGVSGPVAPAWEFRKKKPTVMAAGLHFRVVVHGDRTLELAEALAAKLSATHAPGESAAGSSSSK